MSSSGGSIIEKSEQGPDFELADQDGQPLMLSDLRGRHTVLYFYPEADAPSCTIQACSIRDRAADHEAAGATVLGVSADPVANVKRFHHKQSLKPPDPTPTMRWPSATGSGPRRGWTGGHPGATSAPRPGPARGSRRPGRAPAIRQRSTVCSSDCKRSGVVMSSS